MSKRRIDDLALFGGPPLFAAPRPIGQLETPPVEEYLALVRRIVADRHFTNDGPLVQELEARLAAYHGVRHCIAVANACLGLMMLIQVLARGRHGEVIMPPFTYAGLPNLAGWAGQRPRFCDIAPDTHTLDPAAVAAAACADTTVILAVHQFNSPCSIDALTEVAELHGIPLILDAVQSIGCTYRGRMLGGFGAAEVFSLHATKLLNGFEGGYVTTDNGELAWILRSQRNFGFGPDGGPAGPVAGLNAKLNEFHAAMALLSLDRIDNTIAANRARYHAYQRACAGIPGLRLVNYAAGERNNYHMAVAELTEQWPLDRDRTVALLRAEGAAIGAYYSPPLHLSSHCPKDYQREPLPVSEFLASRFVQLPGGAMTSLDDVAAVGSLLRFVSREGNAIARRMGTEALP